MRRVKKTWPTGRFMVEEAIRRSKRQGTYAEIIKKSRLPDKKGVQ